jgi:hypothetical protein
MASLAAASVALAAYAAPVTDFDQAVKDARMRWEASPHGPLLERILPPTFEPAQLPEPRSRGAQLVVQYCVQCHNLANPAMHNPEKWPGIVDRMVVRMKGKGNMGELMKEMMAGVAAPSEQEEKVLVAYLRKHGQRAIDPRYPELENRQAGPSSLRPVPRCPTRGGTRRPSGRRWSRAWSRTWWMNRVVGTQRNSTAPQLRLDEILGFLQKYARKG